MIVRAVNVTASLPVVSCTAALVLTVLSAVGAAYATVADLPAPIADASVSTTVEPLTDAPVTEMGAPPFVTVN